MLVAITECDSLCRQMHSICLQLLNKPIAYVHTGIPSYPSVKSPLLLPLLLPLPIPTSFPFPPSPLPPSHLPPLPHCPSLHLLLTSSPSPLPTSSHPYYSPPHLSLPVAPFQIPPPCLQPPPPSRLPSTPPHPPFFLSTLPTSHFPLPSPLSGPCQPLSIFFTIAPPPTGSYDH